MPLQIKRLALLFAFLIVAFLVVRYFLVPESFGDIGHYRALALDENKAHDAKYMGETICADCHEDFMELKQSDMHTEISCENCHGPGWKHIEDPGPDQMTIPDGRDFCGRCHEANPARPNDVVVQVSLEDHNPDDNCTECHNPHAPWN